MMNVSVLLTNRVVRWCRVLDLYGYEVNMPIQVHTRQRELVLRAHRPTLHGDPTVLVDVSELWSPGKDPHALGLKDKGCYLQGASWNAQIGGNRPEDAERLDVDRSKSRQLVVHRHPYGRPNAVRQPSPFPSPERWLQDVEEIIFKHYYSIQPDEGD
jgi:hypothetical protein